MSTLLATTEAFPTSRQIAIIIWVAIGFGVWWVWSGRRARQKTCPECAERSKSEAKVCPHCGYRFRPAAADKQGDRAATNG